MESVIDWINAGSTVAIALAAIFTAVLTCHLVRENRLLRKAGTEPEVVAYLTVDSRNIGAIDFVLANIGQGPAKNVQFRLCGKSDDFERHDILLANQTDRKAVSVLPQGERVQSFLGMSHRMLKEPRLRPFDVYIEYENIRGEFSKTIHSLDVSQFSGFSFLGKPPEVKMASALEKIEGILRRVSAGSNRLKVETLARDEARTDRKQAIEKENRRQQKDKSCVDPDDPDA